MHEERGQLQIDPTAHAAKPPNVMRQHAHAAEHVRARDRPAASRPRGGDEHHPDDDGRREGLQKLLERRRGRRDNGRGVEGALEILDPDKLLQRLLRGFGVHRRAGLGMMKITA